jgi:hypothetical protein
MEIFNEHGKPINLKIEIVEQELVQKYIKPEDRVLELGARYGSVSIRTNKIVNDKSSHYVVEPDSAIWECLENNMKINNCNFNIIKGVIAKDKYSVCQKNYSTYTYKDENSKTESYDLPDVDFNVLIVDCEGFFQTFYEENKSLFPKLETIIFEGDEPERCDYDYLLSEFDKLGFKVIEKIKEPTCPNMWHYVLQKDKSNNRQPNLLFCSLSDRPVLSGPMFQRLKSYCDRHNYKCVLEDRILDNSRAASWSKILLLQREMKANPDIDTLVWIDDDILITRPDVRFESLIEPYPFEYVLVSEDVVWSPINCGVLVVKNTKETYEYLQCIWDLCEKYPEKKHGGLWEQDIIVIHERETRLMNPNQSFIKAIPHNIIQSFHRDNTLPPEKKWKVGHFSAHFTGMPLEKRIKYRDEVLTFIQ